MKDDLEMIRGMVRSLDQTVGLLKEMAARVGDRPDPSVKQGFSMTDYYLDEAVKQLVTLHFKLGSPDDTP